MIECAPSPVIIVNQLYRESCTLCEEKKPKWTETFPLLHFSSLPPLCKMIQLGEEGKSQYSFCFDFMVLSASSDFYNTLHLRL